MNGANPDIRDNDGRLTLHWSTNPKTTKPMDTILKVPYYLFIQSIYTYIHIYIQYSLHDINVVDNADMTSLMWACYNCNVRVAKHLFELGSDVEEKDIDGKTAMHW